MEKRSCIVPAVHFATFTTRANLPVRYCFCKTGGPPDYFSQLLALKLRQIFQDMWPIHHLSAICREIHFMWLENCSGRSMVWSLRQVIHVDCDWWFGNFDSHSRGTNGAHVLIWINSSHGSFCGSKMKYIFVLFIVNHTPRTAKLLGGNIGFTPSVCPSVCPSVRPSVLPAVSAL